MSRSEDYLDNLLTSVTDRLSEYDEDFEQNRESLRDSYQTQNDLPSKPRVPWMKSGKKIFCVNLKMSCIKAVPKTASCANSSGN